MRLFCAIAAALLLAVAPAPAPARQAQEETLYLEETKKDFLDRLRKCEEGKDWKGFFEHYQFGLKRYPQSVVSLGGDRWTGLREFFAQRIAKLPPEALAWYRFENDGRARAAFDKARETGSRGDLDRAVDDYFFATGADEVLDRAAAKDLDEGRPEEAIRAWLLLLRRYPDSKLPRAAVAARIAHACLVTGDAASLEDLRKNLARDRIQGEVFVAGRAVDIAGYLQGLVIAPPAARTAAARMPYVPEPEDRLRRPRTAVRNDIRRWVYDFSEERGEQDAPAELQRQAQLQRAQAGRFTPGGVPYGDFPILPAYAKVRGRDYVLFTDGTRIVAIDPSRVKAKSPTAGIYWRHPERPIPRPSGNGNFTVARPFVGVAIDGEYAYATLFSRPEVRPRDAAQAAQDGFEAVTSLKCIHIPSGKLVWDTDLSPLQDELKTLCKEFYDRNFSFSGPPIVRGDRVFLGLCTSPIGEQESRVLCLDRRSGRPIWTTFLSSVAGQGGFLGGNTPYLPVALPMLVESGGALYVQTNLGVVGALNPANGSVLWLSRYRRSARRMQNNGIMEPALKRQASAPILWNGVLYALAQDRADLMAFDAASGEEIRLPPAAEMNADLVWANAMLLQGPVNGALLLPGTVKTFQLRMSDLKANPLVASSCRGSGRSTIVGDRVYLPVTGDETASAGALGVYDVHTWKMVEQPPWKEPGENGNLLVAGDYLIVASRRVSVYTDVETLRGQFSQRLAQSPAPADSLFEFAETMKENDRLEEAAEAYQAYMLAAEGDPSRAARVGEVRRELHGIFLRRGDETWKRLEEDPLKKGDLASRREAARKSLECFALARRFAWDRDSEAEAVRRLAQAFEEQERWSEAVAQYHELIQKGRQLFYREKDGVSKLWDYASRRIDEIVAKSPDAYAELERQAGEALRAARGAGVDALRDVMDRYPNSRAAREAFGGMRELLLKEGRLEKLRAVYGDFRDRFKLDLGFDAYRELLDLLEKLGDLDRLRFELGRFGERFGSETIGADGATEPVSAYVRRKIEILDARERPASGLAGPLRRIAEMDGVRTLPDPQSAVMGHQPLCPLGVQPSGFDADRELFRRGSSIELWDLRSSKRVWHCPHPGAYLGAYFGESAVGVPVVAAKPGSPAEKAGLRRGDLLLTIDGKPVRSATLAELLQATAPGTSVELGYRRGDVELRSRVDLAVMPAELRPAIVGASFTRDGALAVAWEDLIASIDLASGAVQWQFRVSRDQFTFSAFHSTDGRLYAFETIRADRYADALRQPPQGVLPKLRPEDAHQLLFCLSDFTGEVLWARRFAFEPSNPFQEQQITFLGKYFSEYVRFLLRTSRGGTPESVLWIIPAQAGGRSEGKPEHRPLLGQVLAWTAVEESGIFYYVADMMSDSRSRMLYSLSLDPARKDFKPLEIPLHQAKFVPQGMNYSVCSMVASRDHLALLVSPAQPEGNYRILTWKLSDQKDRTLSLLPGRSLGVNRPGGLGLGADGTLYVYNVPRGKAAVIGAGRAFVTAFRLNAPAETDPVAWDSMAPALGDPLQVSFLPDAGAYAVLSSARGSFPDDSGEGAAVVVYDKAAEGSVTLTRMELGAGVDPVGRLPATVWRSRLYLQSGKALEVLGR